MFNHLKFTYNINWQVHIAEISELQTHYITHITRVAIIYILMNGTIYVSQNRVRRNDKEYLLVSQ